MNQISRVIGKGQVVFLVLIFIFVLAACDLSAAPVKEIVVIDSEHLFVPGKVLTFYFTGRIITARVLSSPDYIGLLPVEKIRDTDINSNKKRIILNLAQVQVIEETSEGN